MEEKIVYAVLDREGKIGRNFSNELEIYPTEFKAREYGCLPTQGDRIVKCKLIYQIM